jgi:hypothetical protein
MAALAMKDSSPKNENSVDSEKLSPRSSMEAEKGFTDVELDRSQSTYEPIDCNCTYGDHLAVQRTRSRIQLGHNWSLNDGYCISGTDRDNGDDVEDKKNDQDGAAITIANYLLVTWDENDPMNPRNLGYARKWVIVLIVSLGSVC